MDLSIDDAELRFDCPRCRCPATDDFEVIEPERAADWRCGSCCRLFCVLLVECDRCGSESVNVALGREEQVEPVDVCCPRCGTRGRRHDEFADSEAF